MATSLELLIEQNCFDGLQRLYQHASSAIGLPMRFSVFMPQQAQHGSVPALVYLAGLTCNEETFMTKAGAQRYAAEHGMALIAPDTSPRGAAFVDEAEAWDFGLAASFYLDATQAPWATHYRMESYIVHDLLPALVTHLPLDGQRIGITGHSMGGHGALTLALKHPDVFRSVSALAPVCAPTQCPWGQKAFAGYLGEDASAWRRHDAAVLMSRHSTAPFPAGILVDQGLSDKFLAEQLHPHLLEAACLQAGQPLTLRRHAGYDHGYYFVSTFIGDHVAHHAAALG